MNVVDSCGWLEYFANGTNADFFAPSLEDVDHLIVPSITILEVFKRVLQQRNEDAALQAVSLMQQGKVVALDTPIALNAAMISLKSKIPLADSVIVATAQMYHAVVWTQDADFKGIEGVKYKVKR
ncbi:MAG: type II toxin-antitoxin system VapC family toxin [Chlamydiae bacterium]|nr:type II toxin-antitoxin system VapC family toxin [Chlamydiota bacterium]MBI3277076.1 type II toxin-antitoxin system VapC family toxin [Chlamydiota bacterium]